MSTVTIHYESPANDPFKVPRPHRYTLDGTFSDKSPACEGGEIGPVRLLGFCQTVTPDVDDWVIVQPDDLGDPGYVPTELAGCYAQFIDTRDGAMFGYEIPIARVEVAA